MSQIANMEVKVSADISDLQKGYDKASSDTKQFVSKTTQSLSGLKTGSNEAGQALTNLGRVAQDAPFGFVGIANNLNPLLESFQRLKTTSGSTGGALKALAGSLIGGGGLGIALSLITAAVSFASVGFGSWTRGLKGSQAALDENAKSAKEAADAYQSIIKSISEESGKVQVLIEQLKNENITRKQRAEAIKQLQQISPAYFSTLDREKSTIDDITKAYDAYNAAIIRTITAKVREKELTDITEKIIKLQDKGARAAREQVVINGKLVTVDNARLATQDDLSAGANAYQQFMKGTLFLTQKEQDELATLLITQKQLVDFIAKNKGLQSLNVVDSGGVKKAVKAQIDELDKVVKKVQALPDEIKNGPQGIIPLNIEIRLPTGKLISQAEADYLRGLEDLKVKTAALNEQFAAGLFESFGDGIGESLANGTNIFKNVFSSIFKQFGSYIRQLGVNAILFSKAFAALKLALKSGSVITGIGAGIGLIALGTLISSVGSKVPGFANGVQNFRGGLAVVGERGPELVNLPAGASVTPNHMLGTVSAGSDRVQVTGRIVASGKDLVVLIDNSRQSLNRQS